MTEETKGPGEHESMARRLQSRLRPGRKSSGRGDMIRLGLVIGGAVAVIGAMVALQFVQKKPTAPIITEELEPLETQIPTTAADDLRWEGFHRKWPDALKEPDPAAEIDVNSINYQYFLRQFKRFKAEEVRKRIEDDRKDLLARLAQFNEEDIRFPNDAIRKVMWEHPNVSRGKWFQLDGQLIEIYYQRINTDNPEIPQDVYMGVMRERISKKAVHFFSKEPPRRLDGSKFKTRLVAGPRGKIELIDGGYVRIEGVFVNIRMYESMEKVGRDFVRKTGANMIAISCTELVAAPPPKLVEGLVILLAIVGVIIGALIVFATYMGKRHSAGSLRVRMAKMKLERRRQKAAGKQDWKTIVE